MLDFLSEGFVLEVSSDGTTFVPVAEVEGFETETASWLEWGFAPRAATFARMRSTALAESYGRYYAIVSEIEAYAAGPQEGIAELRWVAPGDDGACKLWAMTGDGALAMTADVTYA